MSPFTSNPFFILLYFSIYTTARSDNRWNDFLSEKVLPTVLNSYLSAPLPWHTGVQSLPPLPPVEISHVKGRRQTPSLNQQCAGDCEFRLLVCHLIINSSAEICEEKIYHQLFQVNFPALILCKLLFQTAQMLPDKMPHLVQTTSAPQILYKASNPPLTLPVFQRLGTSDSLSHNVICFLV